MGFNDKASLRVAQEIATKKKKLELNLLASRKKLEENNRTQLQLQSPPRTQPDQPNKRCVPSASNLKESRKKRLLEGADKVIKKQAPPKTPAFSSKDKSSTPAPTQTVPASVTVSPKPGSGTPSSSVNNAGSRLDLDDEVTSEGVLDTQEELSGDEESTITMSDNSGPATITVRDHKKIVDLAITRAEEIKVKELEKKDAVLNQMKKLNSSLADELKKAQEGKETSSDPVLRQNLLTTQELLTKLGNEKKTTDKAYEAVVKRESERKKKLANLTKELKTLKEQLNKTQEGNEAGNANQEIATLQATVTDLTKQLEEAKNSSVSDGNDQVATLRAKVNDLAKQLEKAKKKASGAPVTRDEQKMVKEIATLKSQLEQAKAGLTKSRNDLTSVKVQLKEAKKDLKNALSADSSAKSTRSTNATKQKLVDLQKKLNDMTSSNRALVNRNETLTKKLELAYKALKKQGKSTKSEQNAQVLQASRVFVKEVVFRTLKLVSSKKPDEVKSFTKKVYDGIKSNLGLEDKDSDDYLDYDDFHRIYQAPLLSYFSTQRSNVQQACLKAVVEWYKEHNFVPRIKDLTSIYLVLDQEKPAPITDDSTEDQKEHMDTYVHKLDLLTWYLDKYLPAAVGDLTFGKSQRYYKKQTDYIELRGKQRVLVERQQEAYGLLVLENCYDKWCVIVPEQAKDPKWKVPVWIAEDPATHPYHKTKFSDPRGGQSAGWKPSARTALNKYCDDIKKRREKDKKSKKGCSVYQKCLDLLRTEHGITDTAPVPKSRKRKRSKNATEEEDFMDVDDESEAPYSVHDSSEEDD